MTLNQDSMNIKPADRIAGFKPYFFSTLNQKITQLRAKGLSVIRLDMGSPDLPPAQFIIDELSRAAQSPNVHGYAPMGGTPEYRRAVAHYYRTRFGVELDPQKEVLALMGSKEGLFTLNQVLLNPGDIALVPDPGYPVYSASGIIAGAEIYPLPLLKKNAFLPDLKAIPPEVASRARILWLNYPNNPTGAVATREFFTEAVHFARENNIVIANDAPYMDICFDNYQAMSILEIPGAMDVAVEFNSLSKTYNMAGWRLGMVAGNSQVISYLHTYKSQADSSHFEAILIAGAAAMTGDQTWLTKRNEVYKERRDIVINALRSVGFGVDTPPAAIYIWARLPTGFEDSEEFCSDLLEDSGVSTTPGTVYGKYGAGYLRISLVTPTDSLLEAMRRVVAWVQAKASNK